MSTPPDDRLKPHHPGLAESPAAHLPPASPQDDDHPPPVSVRLPGPAGSWLRGQVHCPHCNAIIEASLSGLSTYLGPALLQCRTCGRLLRSHRREWADRGLVGRAWYVAFSLLYVALCATLAYLFTLFACVVLGAPEDWPPRACEAFWAAVVVALQVYRVVRSRGRTRSPQRQPQGLTFWSLDSSWQQKLFVAILLASFVGAGLARLLASG